MESHGGIQGEGSDPFDRRFQYDAGSELLNHPTVKKLADKYGRDAGQIILRFETQDGMIVLPKSTKPERTKSNLNIFDFRLTDEEMREMYALDTGTMSHDPDAPGLEEMLRSAFVLRD